MKYSIKLPLVSFQNGSDRNYNLSGVYLNDGYRKSYEIEGETIEKDQFCKFKNKSPKSIDLKILKKLKYLSLEEDYLVDSETNTSLSSVCSAFKNLEIEFSEKEERLKTKYDEKFRTYAATVYRRNEELISNIEDKTSPDVCEITSVYMNSQYLIRKYRYSIEHASSSNLINRLLEFEYLFMDYITRVNNLLKIEDCSVNEEEISQTNTEKESVIPPVSSQTHDIYIPSNISNNNSFHCEASLNEVDSPFVQSKTLTEINESIETDLPECSPLSSNENESNIENIQSSNKLIETVNEESNTVAINKKESMEYVKLEPEFQSQSITTNTSQIIVEEPILPSLASQFNSNFFFKDQNDSSIKVDHSVPDASNNSSKLLFNSSAFDEIPKSMSSLLNASVDFPTSIIPNNIKTDDSPKPSDKQPRFGSSASALGFMPNTQQTLINNKTNNFANISKSFEPKVEYQKSSLFTCGSIGTSSPSPFSQAFKQSKTDLRSPFSAVSVSSSLINQNNSTKMTPNVLPSAFNNKENKSLFDLGSLSLNNKTPPDVLVDYPQPILLANDKDDVDNSCSSHINSSIIASIASSSPKQFSTPTLSQFLNQKFDTSQISSPVNQNDTRASMIKEIEDEIKMAKSYLEKYDSAIGQFKQTHLASAFVPQFVEYIGSVFIGELSISSCYSSIQLFKKFLTDKTYAISSKQTIYIHQYPGALEYISDSLIHVLLIDPVLACVETYRQYTLFALQWVISLAKIYPKILFIVWCKLVCQYPILIGDDGDFHTHQDISRARRICFSLTDSEIPSSTKHILRFKICSLLFSFIYSLSLSNVWYYFSISDNILNIWGPHRVWITLSRIIKMNTPFLTENAIYICDILDMCSTLLESAYKHQYIKLKRYIFDKYFNKMLETFKRYPKIEGASLIQNHMAGNSMNNYRQFYEFLSQFRFDDFSQTY